MSFIFAAALAAAAAPPPAPVSVDAKELACVYDSLAPAERRLAADLLNAEREDQAAEKRAREALDRAVAACAARYRWGDKRKNAGGVYALSRIDLEASQAALPAGLAADRLEAAFLALDEDDRYRFTEQGAKALGRDAEWAERTKAKLIAGGIPQAQLAPAVDYLLTYAQFRAVVSSWETLVKQDIR